MPTRPIDPEIFAKAMSEDKKPIVSIPRTGAGPKPASVPGGGIDAARIRDALRDLGKAPAGRMSLGVRPPG